MNYEKLKEELNGAEFELLVRRFAMASTGEDRGHKKQSLIHFVIAALDKADKEQPNEEK